MPEAVTVEIVIRARDEASEVLDGVRATLEEVRRAAEELAAGAALAMEGLGALRERARAEGYAAGVSYVNGMEVAIREGVPDLEAAMEGVIQRLSREMGRELAMEIGDALARELRLQGVVVRR